MHSLSELRKVTWHLPLELGEVARDRGHVEAPEDRFLGLAVEQEPERRLDTAFWRMLPRRQPLAHRSRHGDVVTGLTLAFADDHLKNERVVLGSAPDLNHIDLLRDTRILKGFGPCSPPRPFGFSVMVANRPEFWPPRLPCGPESLHPPDIVL